MRRCFPVILGAILTATQTWAQTPPRTPQPSSPPGVPPAPLPSSLLNAPVADVPVPPPAPRNGPPLTENLRTFDPSRVEVKWVNRCWRLVSGDGSVLKDFGRRESEARQAHRVVRELQLSQYGTVCSPGPLMEYWLADGRAPLGHAACLHAQPIDPATLRAEQSQGQWCVRDSRRILLNFGQHGDEARRAVAVLRKYGFTQVGSLGAPAPSMVVFFRKPSDGPFDPPKEGTVVQASFKPGKAESEAAPSAAERELRRIQARFPGAGVNTVITPAVRPLHTPERERDQPRSAFASGAAREIKVAGHGAANGPWSGVPRDEGGRVALDWRKAQVRKEGGVWKLFAGGYLLAEFGGSEADARNALAAVRYYRPTEHCHVGPPGIGCSYFLDNGQAPRGVMLGVPGENFRPEQLRVGPADGGWAVCDGTRPLIFCGGSEDDAKEMLDAIQRYRFDRLCRIGLAGKGLMFLARAR